MGPILKYILSIIKSLNRFKNDGVMRCVATPEDQDMMPPVPVFHGLPFLLALLVEEVEAERKVMSLGNWFGSYEKTNLQNADGKENIAPDTTEQSSLKFHYKKKLKKRKNNKLKFLKKDVEWVADDDSGGVVKKTKKRRKKLSGHMKKSVQRDAKDNATSDSEEPEKRRKPPVDIIVHIKMNE